MKISTVPRSGAEPHGWNNYLIETSCALCGEPIATSECAPCSPAERDREYICVKCAPSGQVISRTRQEPQ